MQIGAYEILPVLDGEGRFPPLTSFAGTTESDWAPHRALLDENGMLPLAVGGFLVRGGPAGRIVLVDIGVGDRVTPLISGGKFLQNLAGYGVEPQDVTDVVFTHLHFDHTGWASVDGRPVFANAAYRCDPRDWDYWIEDPPRLPNGEIRDVVALQQQLLQPIAGQLEPWGADGPIVPGLNVVHAPGHTPGSAILVVSDGDARAMLLGDVVHCPAELVESEWAGLADLDPALAKRTKQALIREIEGTDVPVAAAHFAGMEFGRLLSAQGKRYWTA